MSLTLSSEIIKKAAAGLGVEPAALQAVCHVESAGSGFLAPGRPKILFEGHVFWRELKKAGYTEAELEKLSEKQPDILYKKWTSAYYKGAEKQYERLEKARQINKAAADASASWGGFQIMGNNYSSCGFKSVEDFVNAHCESAEQQLKAFCSFIRNTRLDGFLKDKEWAKFAHGYNGPGYSANEYDKKLAQAYSEIARTHGARLV